MFILTRLLDRAEAIPALGRAVAWVRAHRYVALTLFVLWWVVKLAAVVYGIQLVVLNP